MHLIFLQCKIRKTCLDIDYNVLIFFSRYFSYFLEDKSIFEAPTYIFTSFLIFYMDSSYPNHLNLFGQDFKWLNTFSVVKNLIKYLPIILTRKKTTTFKTSSDHISEVILNIFESSMDETFNFNFLKEKIKLRRDSLWSKMSFLKWAFPKPNIPYDSRGREPNQRATRWTKGPKPNQALSLWCLLLLSWIPIQNSVFNFSVFWNFDWWA